MDTPSLRDIDQRERWDRNGLTPLEREYFIHIRGLAFNALNLVHWIHCQYEFTDTDAGNSLDFETDIAGRYLTDQACAILNYKKRADAQNISMTRHFNFKDLETQLDYVLGTEGDPEEWFGDWEEKKQGFEIHDSLSFGPRDHLQISKKDAPFPFKGMLVVFILPFFSLKIICIDTPPRAVGMTKGDKKFLKGLSIGFPSTKSPVELYNSPSESEETETETEDVEDEEYRPTKRKRSGR